LINDEKETVNEFGLIIGGSCIQPMNRDFDDAVANNEIMATPYAPAIFLLGFNDSTRIAVESAIVHEILANDVITKIGQQQLKQQPRNSAPEVKDITILEARNGFVLRRDVNHAGIGVTGDTSDIERRTWNKAESILNQVIFQQFGKDDAFEYNNLIFEHFCEIPLLHTISHVFFTTNPI
jgi:hypothetical protein